MAGEPKDFPGQARLRPSASTTTPSRPFPPSLWDVFGEKGHPVRTTGDRDGAPLLLSRLMSLTERAGRCASTSTFRIADRGRAAAPGHEKGSAVDACQCRRAGAVRDQRALRQCHPRLRRRHQRALLGAGGGPGRRPLLRRAGTRCHRTDAHLARWPRRHQYPRRRPAWMTQPAPLFHLPSSGCCRKTVFREAAGDRRPDQARCVFFFDEAHLLFQRCAARARWSVSNRSCAFDPASKGLGRLFRHPREPARRARDGVLAQLGNRVQHALRAYSPREQALPVKTAADTFRPNPDFDSFEAITNLGHRSRGTLSRPCRRMGRHRMVPSARDAAAIIAHRHAFRQRAGVGDCPEPGRRPLSSRRSTVNRLTRC